MPLTDLDEINLNAIFRQLILESGFREGTLTIEFGTELRRLGYIATDTNDGLMSSSDKLKLNTFISNPQTLSGPGAASAALRTTFLTSTAAGNAITLGAGVYAGQHKTITGSSGYTAGNTSVITPASFLNGTTITFSTKFDSVELEWSGTGWRVVYISGSTVIA